MYLKAFYIMKTNNYRWTPIFLLLFFLSAPSISHAGAFISEIMYAPSGADAKHEWVEVCNDATNDIDLNGWKFYENATNHSLVLFQGSGVLSQNKCAVIADDATTFMADNPSVTASVFDSVFSLKNTGETISIKDTTGSEINTATYTDTLGAKDDGNSLARGTTNGTFAAGAPTPGVFSSGSAGSGGGSTGARSTSGSSASGGSSFPSYRYQTVTIEPPQDVYVRVPKQITTTEGAQVIFNAEGYDAQGRTVKDAGVKWSFGDGRASVGYTAVHSYVYAGEYIVSVTLTKGILSDTQKIAVSVQPLEAKVSYDDLKHQWIAIQNNATHDLDISHWRLQASGQYFIFPENTIIGAGRVVKFSKDTTHITMYSTGEDIALYFPNGKLALKGHRKVMQKTATATSTATTTTKTKSSNTMQKRPIQKQVLHTTQSSHQKPIYVGVRTQNRSVKTQKKKIINSESAKTNTFGASALSTTDQTAAVVLTDTHKKTSTAQWYILIAILLFTVSGIVYITQKKKRLVVEGFEVVEE